MHINPFIKLSAPLFSLLENFRQRENSPTLTADFYKVVFTEFNQLEASDITTRFSHRQIESVIYALAALFDEIVMSSSWTHRHLWMSNPLQLQRFGEHLAGEGFFKRLSELRLNVIKNIDVLEIYYICLQLGFEGSYRCHGVEKLHALRSDLYQQILLIRGDSDSKIAQKTLSDEDKILQPVKKLPWWLILSVSSSLLLLIYLSFSIAINHQATLQLRSIKKNHQQLVLFLRGKQVNDEKYDYYI